MEVTIGIAFIAGLVSFISPCVLPLVPAYIGYLGGRTVNTISISRNLPDELKFRANTFVHGLFFVLGFSIVFVLIGLLSTAFVQQVGGSNIHLTTSLIGRVGGVIIILFGLHFMGAVPRIFAYVRASDGMLESPWIGPIAAVAGAAVIAWSINGTVLFWQSDPLQSNQWAFYFTLAAQIMFFIGLFIAGAFREPDRFWRRTMDYIEQVLYSDTRHQMTIKMQQGYWGSVVMGIVFSAGWTPCIGPVYGTVLTMAANGGDVSQASIMLLAYSLGLGVPFLLTALMLSQMQGLLLRIKRQMRTVELVSGAFLIFIGILVASGQLQNLSQQFAGQFAEFSIGIEEDVVSFFAGESSPDSGELVIDSTVLEQPKDDRPQVETTLVGLEVGNHAPDFTLSSVSGEVMSLSGLRGRAVLLNFWATWCGPCRVEMPAFQVEYEKYVDDGFIILAVNNSESASAVMSFQDELDLTFPLVLDAQGEVQQQYGIFSYPSTFVIDANGVITYRHFGTLTVEQIEQLVQQQVAVRQ